jgi:hypothetical protein
LYLTLIGNGCNLAHRLCDQPPNLSRFWQSDIASSSSHAQHGVSPVIPEIL